MTHKESPQVFATDSEGLFKEGFQCLRNGNAGEAVRCLDKASIHGTALPNLHFARATALLQLGNLASAKEACGTELSQYPENIHAKELLERIKKLEIELVASHQHAKHLKTESVSTCIKKAAPKSVCMTTKQMELLQDQGFRERLRENAFKGDEPCKLQQFVTVGHKCASVYIFKLLDKLAHSENLNYVNYSVIWKHNRKNPEVKQDYNDFTILNKNKVTLYLAGRGLGVLEPMDFCQTNNIPFKSVFVIRDPRDIIISKYFSKKYSHPIISDEMQTIRDSYCSMNNDDGIDVCIDLFESTNASSLCRWQEYLDDPRVLFLSYEFMKANSLLFFSTMLKFLEIDISLDCLSSVLDKRNFATLSGRNTGVEDTKNHYRKGVVGDWKNYFTDRHIKHFFSNPNCSKVFYGFGYNNPNR